MKWIATSASAAWRRRSEKPAWILCSPTAVPDGGPVTSRSLWLWTLLSRSSRTNEVPASSYRAHSLVALIEPALRIGRGLCESAYWDREGRYCNWVGRSPLESEPSGVLVTPTSAALAPHLYPGSSGVGLFLLELYRVTGDEEFRRTATGAIARSVRQLRRPADKNSLSAVSFHFGALGIAYAAWRATELFSNADLLADARTIAASVGEAISCAA